MRRFLHPLLALSLAPCLFAQPGANLNPTPELKLDTNGTLPQSQVQQLIRIVTDKDTENEKHVRDYTYVEHEEQRMLDAKGRVKSTEIKTYEVMEIYGEPVQRLIAKSDKPLDARDTAKEEEKIQKIINKRKNESEADRRKREQKEQKSREDNRQFVREVADAYNFNLAGMESIGGRDAWVIDAQPRPGYEPHAKDAKFLPKFRFRVWVDKKEHQWEKLDIACIDTVSLGFFLARIHKGSHIVIEQNQVNEEVWLPTRVQLNVDVRLALLKNFNLEMEQTFHDYKKFRTGTRILGMSGGAK